MVISDRTRLLASTIKKLFHRGANTNIRRIIKKSHNADIAAVMQIFTEEEAYGLFQMVPDPDTQANIISYLDSETQKMLLDRLSTETAAELVELMEPDDAADLLSLLPDEDSKNIIEGLMEESSTEVVDLMGYPEDSAGGIMSSDYLALPEATTVEQVIQELQSEDSENKVAFYIYVVNRTDHLVGVVSLKQILLSRKTTQLRDLMTTNVISVNTDTDQEQVASHVAQYDFLSLPVVDKSNVLVGVITVDDVIDVIKQEAEEDLLSMAQAGWGLDRKWYEHLLARLPWLSLSFVVGLICFFVIYSFGPAELSDPAMQRAWGFAAILPLVLSLGVMAGNQSATIMVSALQSGKLIGNKIFEQIGTELLINTISAILFGGLIFLISGFALDNMPHERSYAFAVIIQTILASAIGSILPLIFFKLKADALTMTPPIYAALADISSVLILLFFFNAI